MRMCGYARVSTDEDKQLDSLEHQTQFFSGFASAHGHHLVHVYADEGITGRQLKKRDAFNRMMKDSELGLFDILVVKDVSRFARNTVDLLTSIRQLKARGIEVLFVNNSQKVLGESEFIITLLGAMAQEESANLSKRVKFGKNINSQKGRVPPRIFGYDRIDNFTLQINEMEAEVVRTIFRLYVEDGYGCNRIAKKLEECGYTTKYGDKWNQRGVRRILQNSIYCGRYVNHRYHVPDFLEGGIKPLPPEEYYHHDRPEWAIVTPEIFQRAQDVLKERSTHYQSNYIHRTGRYSNRHLFSTFIRCAECGRAFSRRCVHYASSDYVYWRCPTHDQYANRRCANNTIIREDHLIDVLSDYLRSIIDNKEAFAQTLAERYAAEHWQKIKNVDVDDLEAKKTKLQKSKNKYMDMYANDLLTMDALKQKVAAIDEAIARADDQLLYARSETRQMLQAEDLIHIAMQEIEQFLSLQSATNMDLRRVLDHITVDAQKKITIHLKVQNLQ